jgi:hypothetical protein
LPDRHLAWHLSAILAAMCAGSKEGDPQHQVLQATRLGIALAAWSTRQHLHHFRQAFPADDLGPFVGQSLSILRFLSATPSSVRQIQRRLRGLNKEACLWTLRRGVAAGLALEPEPERFTSVPLPGQELADFVAEFELPEAKPQDFSPNSTDGTDKPSS